MLIGDVVSIFDCFSPITSDRKWTLFLLHNVISSVAVDNVGMNVPMKFGDFRSNGFRDIQEADFVLNERTNERTLAKPIPIARTANI